MNEQASLAEASVLIAGGGLVGASLAIALDAAGRATTLVETALPRASITASRDERNLALSRATVNGLQAIGVWPYVIAEATPIKHIRVSRSGDFGSARLDAARHGVDALGWTLPARELGAALQRRLDRCTQLRRIASASVIAIEQQAAGWRAQLSTGASERFIDTPLLIGADGTDSFVRTQLGIAADNEDYRQTLFVCTIATERAHANRAWERFSDDGPIAVLPLADGRCGLVLTVATDAADEVAQLNDTAFIALAQRRFGWRLGRLSQPGRRHAHPIRRVAAARVTATRAVLVGNAAQTIHPIGAQGFNLGLRDALTLAELVATAADPGAPELLKNYAARRQSDRAGTMAMSHGLVRLACLPQPLLAPLRSLALLAYDRLPPLQRALTRRGMGFRGEPPQAVLERTP